MLALPFLGLNSKFKSPTLNLQNIPSRMTTNTSYSLELAYQSKEIVRYPEMGLNSLTLTHQIFKLEVELKLCVAGLSIDCALHE